MNGETSTTLKQSSSPDFFIVFLNFEHIARVSISITSECQKESCVYTVEDRSEVIVVIMMISCLLPRPPRHSQNS